MTRASCLLMVYVNGYTSTYVGGNETMDDIDPSDIDDALNDALGG